MSIPGSPPANASPPASVPAAPPPPPALPLEAATMSRARGGILGVGAALRATRASPYAGARTASSSSSPTPARVWAAATAGAEATPSSAAPMEPPQADTESANALLSPLLLTLWLLLLQPTVRPPPPPPPSTVPKPRRWEARYAPGILPTSSTSGAGAPEEDPLPGRLGLSGDMGGDLPPGVDTRRASSAPGAPAA